MTSLKEILSGHKIKKCFIECYREKKKETEVDIVLTTNFFHLSKSLGNCFVHITKQGSLFLVFSDDASIITNPPPGSLMGKFSVHLRRVEDFNKTSTTFFRLIEETQFSITLEDFFVSGNVNVYLDCFYDSSINVILKNNAVVRMSLGSGRTHVGVSQSSNLKLQGVIKHLKINHLELGSSISLYHCKLDKILGYEFGIPISYPVGNLIIPPELSELRDAVFLELYTQWYKQRVETTRQIHVRTKISIPISPKLMTKATEHDDDRVCHTCYAYLSNAKFDCGHVYMCLYCAEKMRTQKYSNFTCPLCVKEISTVEIVHHCDNTLNIDKRERHSSSSSSSSSSSLGSKRTKRQRSK